MKRHLDGQAGFSLPELLVSMGIIIIIVTAAFALMKQSLRMSNTSLEMTDAQQQLRNAQEQIRRDLLNTGDQLMGVSDPRVPLTFVTQNITTNPVNPVGQYVQIPFVVSDDAALRAFAPTNVLNGTDRITVMSKDIDDPNLIDPWKGTVGGGGTVITKASTELRNTSIFNVGEVYFIYSGYGSTFGAITAKTATSLTFGSDTYGLNRSGNGGTLDFVSVGDRAQGNPAVTVNVIRVKLITFYVDNDMRLIRRIYGIPGSGMREDVVAEHVKNCEIKYDLSLPNLWQRVDQLDTAERQAAVRQVQVSFTTETAHNVNGAGAAQTRQEISSTTSTGLRNMEFNEALQPTPVPTP
jgi:type II secretory pathway pseudopilin PulG